MSSSDWSGFDVATQAVRAGQVRSAEGEHNDSIFATSSFVFRDAREAAARFAETEPGNVYSRFTNPTVRTFEQRLAALEGGGYCVATASGMGAILTLCLAVLRSGDHVIASRDLFGSTVSLFTKILAKFGIDTTFVALSDIDGWRDALQPQTKLLFLESPSNPLSEVADLAAMVELARAHGVLLAVDNVMCTPVLQRPFEYGADIVVHSATKYLDGQGRCIGGAVVARDEELYNQLFTVLRTAGPSMSPFNAWVFLKGLETLSLRMYAHSHNAMALAE
ncbi:MAG: aminotransferase class I/II-fold pyridoxal phosphate-dependent enzyme, partial [Gammaproteobacteria bacterium]|nr:aminotransferase class I/II-fold pyridoxal phosphate-dependent enzyme [Gammaproteobacteria bacterium]